MADLNTSGEVVVNRLQDQIEWYDKKSRTNQRWYKSLKIVTIVSAAVVPATSVAKWTGVSAGLGMLVVVVEALQQLNQFQASWISYRSTCEALKHEKYLYFATAGPYAASDRPLALLAERVEGLVSQEHAKWVSTREQDKAEKADPKAV